MKKSKYQREDLYTCIVIYVKLDGSPGGATFHKIRMDQPATRDKNMEYWKRKLPTATHVNVYGGISRKFKEQIKFDHATKDK